MQHFGNKYLSVRDIHNFKITNVSSRDGYTERFDMQKSHAFNVFFLLHFWSRDGYTERLDMQNHMHLLKLLDKDINESLKSPQT